MLAIRQDVRMTANPDEGAIGAATAAGPRVGRIPADTFSNRLVLARRLAGMTIEEAAEAANLSKSSWANWENGRRPQGQVDVCQAIASALDVDFNWLLLGGALESSRGRPTKRSVPGAGRGDAEGKAGDVSNLAVSADAWSAEPIGELGNRRGSVSTVRPSDTRPKVRSDSSRSKSPSVAGRRAAPIW
jgi:transcriptional regulator with XRE-family HTH domain